MKMTLIIATLLVGCAAHQHTRYTPAARPLTAEPTAAYGAAVRVLTDAGYSVEMQDPTAGVIRTGWTRRAHNLYRWRVTIRAGRMDVTSECLAMQGGGGYGSCAGYQHADRTELTARLADAILADAQ